MKKVEVEGFVQLENYNVRLDDVIFFEQRGGGELWLQVSGYCVTVSDVQLDKLVRALIDWEKKKKG
jgi:hypothetical protein